MAAYYNEIEPFAAAWLRELIKRELIAPGDVDERSIADVQPDDVRGYTQCHFFAGIGVWSYALFNAGWADTDPVWTGSCPCQPFSPAGKGEGFADPRHLWPHFYRLIRECRPHVVFGEQTESKAGRTWLDLVSADVEGIGYAIGPAVFPAAGVGAPHIRHRIYWVADAGRQRCDGQPVRLRGREPRSARLETAGSGTTGGVAHAERERGRGRPSRSQDAGDVGFAGEAGGPVNGFWSDAEWLACTDGKTRPAESGTFPLAYGAPAYVGRLRGYGNAVVAEQAQAFIEAYLDVRAGL